MKGKDLLILAGGALLAYMLIPKEKVQAAVGGVSIIPQLIPGPTQFIERLIPGPTQIIPQIIPQLIPQAGQLVPEINIPEFKWPDITMPEINIPDFPEQIIPALPDELGLDMPSLIPDVTGLIPGAAAAKEAAKFVYEKPSFPKYMGEVFGGYGAGVMEKIEDRFAMLLGQPTREQRRISILSEAQFEAAGVEEIGSMEDIQKLQRAGEITGIREMLGYPDPEDVPAIGSPDYLYHMLGKPAPYRRIE